MLAGHQLSYDALGRHIATLAVGTEVPQYELGTTALIHDGNTVAVQLGLGGPHDVIRSNFLTESRSGEALAVDIHGETIWTFSDLSGTIRSYASVKEVSGTDEWKILHREFDEVGNIVANHADGVSAALTPVVWQGNLRVYALGYQLGSRWFDGETNRFMSDGGGLSGYRMGNNNPNARVTVTQTYAEAGAPSSSNFNILAWPQTAYHWVAGQVGSLSNYFSSAAINSDSSLVSASAGTAAVATAGLSGYVHQLGSMLGVLDVPTIYSSIRGNYAAYAALGIDAYTATVLQFHPMAGGVEAWDGISYQAHEFNTTLDGGDRALRAFNSTLATAGTALGGVAGLRNVLGVQHIESFAHVSSAAAQRVRQVSHAGSALYTRATGAVAPKGAVTLAERQAMVAARTPEEIATRLAKANDLRRVRDGIPSRLYHYTNDTGEAGIVGSQQLRPSLKAVNPKDARYGDGQYLSDIAPGTRTPAELSYDFLRVPYQGRKFTNYIEVDVTGLRVIRGRDGVYVIPNGEALDLSGRIISRGRHSQ